MRAPRRALLGLSYLAFVSLGLPDAVLGVAWPTLHLELGVDRAALGAVLTSAGAAYVVSGLLSGQLIQRWGTGALLSASTLSVTLGLVGYALAPRWAVFLIAALFVGAGSGAIDAGLNGYAARTFPPRQMSWLHAAYSVGAAIGPALMTIFVATARGWRGGYAVLAATLGALSLVFLSVRRAWESPGGGAARADELLPPPPAGRPPAPTHRGRAAGAGAILPPPPAGWPPALAHEGHAASAGAGAILPPPPAGWPPAPAHRGHAPSADELLPPPPAGRPPAPAHRGQRGERERERRRDPASTTGALRGCGEEFEHAPDGLALRRNCDRVEPSRVRAGSSDSRSASERARSALRGVLAPGRLLCAERSRFGVGPARESGRRAGDERRTGRSGGRSVGPE